MENFKHYRKTDIEKKLENIIEELSGILLNFDTPEFKETDYTDIDKIKDRIIFELVNYKMNEERLSGRPFIKIMDLAIIFAFVATDLGRDFGVVHITDEMANNFGLTKNEIWDIAKINTPKLLEADIIPMSSFVPGEVADTETEEMYILCNKKKAGGAGVLLYDRILEELSSKLESDLYILPSSIHETIIIRADKDKNISDLQDMVKNINNTVVSTEDILSDKVYHYIRSNKELKIA